MSGFILVTKWSGEESMTELSSDATQGTLDMLILRSLSLQPMHGFGITRRIEQIRNACSR